MIKTAFAQAINVSPPEKGGFKTIGNFITNALTIAFGIAVLLVLAYLIWGAFEWITSGGDKDNVAKARNMITHAIIGFIILMFAFLILQFLLSSLFEVTGLQIF